MQPMYSSAELDEYFIFIKIIRPVTCSVFFFLDVMNLLFAEMDLYRDNLDRQSLRAALI